MKSQGRVSTASVRCYLIARAEKPRGKDLFLDLINLFSGKVVFPRSWEFAYEVTRDGPVLPQSVLCPDVPRFRQNPTQAFFNELCPLTIRKIDRKSLEDLWQLMGKHPLEAPDIPFTLAPERPYRSSDTIQRLPIELCAQTSD